ncbi:hypothetical protein Hdeb2414_s0033g00721851 [Helianthus debilis subsp. tardiflorus]
MKEKGADPYDLKQQLMFLKVDKSMSILDTLQNRFMLNQVVFETLAHTHLTHLAHLAISRIFVGVI